MNKTQLEKLKNIQLLLLDVDGTLTDGRIIMGDGKEYKAFNVQDGLGIVLLQKAGIPVGIITGRSSDVVAERAAELKVKWVFQGAIDKNKAYASILKEAGLKAENVCFIGDDLNDLPLIRRSGFGVAVAQAAPEVIELADCTTVRQGGDGAVREVIEIILKAQEKWADLIHNYTC
ncbi:HAD-IIIA family hydrolase [bacterium]|nr:HAD-IIIA family hydrolase [bacterium]